MLPICPYCTSSLNEISPFCTNCGKQARCKSCKSILNLNARFCAECGVGIGEPGTSKALIPTTDLGSRNIIRYEEKGKSRSLYADLTDKSVASLRDPLLVGLGGALGNGEQDSTKPTNKVTNPKQLPLALGGSPDDNNEDVIEGEVLDSRDSMPDKEGIKSIFDFDEQGNAKCINPDLKAKGKGDHAQRLTHLFLYSHELRGNTKVTRDELTAILNDAGVNDGNFRAWLIKKNHPTLMKEGDSIRLNHPGRLKAQEHLKQFFDPTVKSSWSLGTASARKSKSKDGDLPTGSKSSKGSELPADVSSWISQWRALAQETNVNSLIKDKTSAEKVILGLWAIGKVNKNLDIVVPLSKILHFLGNSTFAAKIANGGTLTRNLAQDADKINKVPNGYQLQPEGIKYGKLTIEDKIKSRPSK